MSEVQQNSIKYYEEFLGKPTDDATEIFYELLMLHPDLLDRIIKCQTAFKEKYNINIHGIIDHSGIKREFHMLHILNMIKNFLDFKAGNPYDIGVLGSFWFLLTCEEISEVTHPGVSLAKTFKDVYYVTDEEIESIRPKPYQPSYNAEQ